MRAAAAITCLLLSAVVVSADLQSDIEDVTSHLPMKEIISIGKQYVAKYPSYAEGLRYVENISYEKLVKDFLESKEGQIFVDYFNYRDIDIESIWLYMTKKTVEVNRKWLEPIQEGEFVGPTITGDIMADYKKAIVESDFLDFVHKKMEASPEFAKLVAAFKDPGYHALFYRVVEESKTLGDKKNAEVRGFWKKAWKVTQAVAIGSAILG